MKVSSVIDTINELAQPVNNFARNVDIEIRDEVKVYAAKVRWFIGNLTLTIEEEISKADGVDWIFEHAYSNKNFRVIHNGKNWQTDKAQNGAIIATITGNAPKGNEDGRLSLAVVMGLDHIFVLDGKGSVISKKTNKIDIAKDVVKHLKTIQRIL